MCLFPFFVKTSCFNHHLLLCHQHLLVCHHLHAQHPAIKRIAIVTLNRYHILSWTTAISPSKGFFLSRKRRLRWNLNQNSMKYTHTTMNQPRTQFILFVWGSHAFIGKHIRSPLIKSISHHYPLTPAHAQPHVLLSISSASAFACPHSSLFFSSSLQFTNKSIFKGNRKTRCNFFHSSNSMTVSMIGVCNWFGMQLLYKQSKLAFTQSYSNNELLKKIKKLKKSSQMKWTHL